MVCTVSVTGALCCAWRVCHRHCPCHRARCVVVAAPRRRGLASWWCCEAPVTVPASAAAVRSVRTSLSCSAHPFCAFLRAHHNVPCGQPPPLSPFDDTDPASCAFMHPWHHGRGQSNARRTTNAHPSGIIIMLRTNHWPSCASSTPTTAVRETP